MGCLNVKLTKQNEVIAILRHYCPIGVTKEINSTATTDAEWYII